MNKDNPFIDATEHLTETQRLQSTVFNAVNVFAVLETLLADPAGGSNEITFGLEEYTGLQVIIAGAKGALKYVADEIDLFERKPPRPSVTAVDGGAP